MFDYIKTPFGASCYKKETNCLKKEKKKRKERFLHGERRERHRMKRELEIERQR